jgi:hypothetical protein
MPHVTLTGMSNGSPSESRFPDFISSLARNNSLTPDFIRSLAKAAGFSNWSEKRLIKATVQLAKEFRLRGQLGRLRAAVLFGTSLVGDSFVTAIERAGILLADDHTIETFGRFLEGLRTEIDDVNDWRRLQERLPTYEAYRQLVIATSQNQDTMIRLLRTRPRHIIKKVLAITDLGFLKHHFGVEILPELAPLYEELGIAEEMASAASFLIVQANHYRPLDSTDLGLPAISNLAEHELWALIRYGYARSQQHDIGKQISLFGYRLEHIHTAQGPVFYVQPPFMEFEYFSRLGFIRAELSTMAVSLHVNRRDAVPELSFTTAAEFFVNRLGKQLCEIVDQDKPYRRVLVRFPLDPKLYAPLMEGSFYDDAADEELLGRDFLFPLQRASESELMLTDMLDLRTFMQIWRLLRFMALVDIAALKSYARHDPMLFVNSLVRVSTEDNILDLIAVLGVQREQSREFLRLVSADVHRLGYYDLQYRPFLRVAAVTLPKMGFTSQPEIVHASAVVAVSNIVRNVQSANQIRLRSNASIFVDVVADMFKSRCQKVTTNRRIEAHGENTDVDVAVLQGDALYLFECKHSVPPTGPHEMRDIWEEIENGVRQLQTALRTLADSDRLHNYLTGWFPGTKKQQTRNLRILPCVLCSHRIFSGLAYENIPIRDFASLALLADNGVVRVGVLNPDGESILVRHRLTSEGGFSSTDLEDYLSSESKYFKMFRPFMRPLSRLQRVGHVTVARDTYAYEFDSEDYLSHLEAIGCARLPDEQKTLKTPVPLETFLSQKLDENASRKVETDSQPQG